MMPEKQEPLEVVGRKVRLEKAERALGKAERVNFLVTPQKKQEIQTAADRFGLSMTDYLVRLHDMVEALPSATKAKWFGAKQRSPLLIFVYSYWDSSSVGQVLEVHWRNEAGAGALFINDANVVLDFLTSCAVDGFVKPTGRSLAGGLPEMGLTKARPADIAPLAVKLLGRTSVAPTHAILTVHRLGPDELVERLERWKAAHPILRRAR